MTQGEIKVPRQRYRLRDRPAPGRSVTPYRAETANIRCPHCGRNGAFSGYAQSPDIQWQQASDVDNQGSTTAQAGMRWCPNVECGGLVFVIHDLGLGHRLVLCYPAELKEFDPDRLPDTVRECIEEAIKCHAQGCYRATALMVRKTLEELCQDRKALGANLFERIESLRKQIIISQDLIDGAHELRFLGNDAAHVEAREFQNVGRDETDVAIDLAKELLRATYHTASLVDRMRSLKAVTPPKQAP